ncbi:MAG: hypothetical protein H7070_16195 [Saprospiraceae bacterium]|nr:hypothetical protein [Pyrinomonadaceae bacterium]
MAKNQRKAIKSWITRWEENGTILERIRIEEHHSSNLSETLLSLSDVNDAALLAHPPKPYSGIIEMQRIFAKLRNK